MRRAREPGSIVSRRWRNPAGCLALAFGIALAGPAAAHGFGQRYDLPIPLSFYVAGAGATVALSFVCLALFLRPGHALPLWHVDWHAKGRVVGALAALMHRRETGEGQLVQTDLLRSALNVSSFILTEQALTGRDRVATGNRAQSSCPADIVRTRDGWIMLQCVGQPLYRRWARLMGEEKWLSDPRFSTDELRAEHGEILSERTSRWAEERTTEQALAELAAARIPAAPVLSPRQVLEDPHVREGGYLQQVDYPGLPRPATLVTSGVNLSLAPASIRIRPPTIGEHTAEVLQELGYTSAEIAGFRARKLV